jgi:HK97 family phage major capsid protein/HK97 family phage prohead protease
VADDKPTHFTYGMRAATDSEPDGYDFVMSDGSVDRIDDVIDQEGWSLGKFRKNPVALFSHDKSKIIGKWEKVRVENGTLVGTLKLLAAGKDALVDYIRALLDERMLNAVSVGFIPLEFEPRAGAKRGGVTYKKSELLECSAVAVPANGNALRIRTLDLPVHEQVKLLAASGNRSLPELVRGLTAASGTLPSTDRRKSAMSLAERIEAAQTELIALHDLQAPLTEKISGGDDLDDAEQTEFDRIVAETAKVQKRLDTYRITERNLGQSAANRNPDPNPNPERPNNPAIITNRGNAVRGKERPMDLLVRLAVVNLRAYVKRLPLDVVRAESYPDRIDMDACIRAVTNPAQTTVATWAAELVESAIDDFMDTLKPLSVYAQLASLGTKFTFGRNGVIKIPRRNKVKNAPGDLRGAFVGEGQPIPVRRASFGSVALTPHKMGVISEYTREMALHSTPAIEALIREGIVEDTADAIDTALLDAVAGDAIRPAGLMNGVVPVAGTAGGGVAAMTADIAAALGPFIAANAADRLVWLINPINAFKLQWASSAVGVYPFREQVAAGNLGGIPLIQSTNVGATDLILTRYADFASGTADTPEFDVSDVATIHEEDGGYPADQAMRPGTSTVLPIATGAAGAGVLATPTRSLWQTASIGIRMLLDMDWAMRRAGMVSKVNNITW